MNRIIYLFFLFLLYSCVTPFEIDDEINSNIVNVNGIFSNIAEENYITLTLNIPRDNGNKGSAAPITDATVKIIGSDGSQLRFVNSKQNREYYYPETPNTPKNNINYYLSVILENGTEIKSSIETLPQPTELEKVEEVLDTYKEGIITFGKYNLNVSFVDPPITNTNYKWIYSIIEEKQICKTCLNNREYIRFPLPGSCEFIRTLPDGYFFINNLDYYCDDYCFAKLEYDPLVIYSDLYSNGGKIENLSIGSFPLFEFSPTLVKMLQMSISNRAYKYNELLQNLGKKPGTLADTPPVALIGNLNFQKAQKNTFVAGYFYVTHISSKLKLIKKKNLGNIKPLKLIGRFYFEPPFPLFSPKAPCIEDRFNSKTIPDNWFD